jgi:hypothetical protein
MAVGSRVATVMITCPATGQDVATGFSALSAADFERMRFELLMVKCPWCTHVHVWSKCDAFLGVTDTAVENSRNKVSSRSPRGRFA